MKCLICNKKCARISNLSRHLTSKHNITKDEYFSKYYNCIDKNKNVEKCGFCNNNSTFKYVINEDNKTFIRNYENNYCCGTIECKNEISLNILGKPYDKKSFEHIGSSIEYISKIRKISINDANNTKFNVNRVYQEKSRTSLNGYILRYGSILGPIKYKERCEKIGKSNTLDWYIEKFGYELGKQKYDSYIKKLKNNGTGIQISKSSQCIKILLEGLKIEYKEEYPVTVNGKIKPKLIDFYLPKYNLCLEFFGTFWHCNPKIYDKYYYHKHLHKYAFEKWEMDRIRNNQIIESTKGSLLIFWEDSIIDKNNNCILNQKKLVKYIKELKKLNNIIYV